MHRAVPDWTLREAKRLVDALSIVVYWRDFFTEGSRRALWRTVLEEPVRGVQEIFIQKVRTFLHCCLKIVLGVHEESRG